LVSAGEAGECGQRGVEGVGAAPEPPQQGGARQQQARRVGQAPQRRVEAFQRRAGIAGVLEEIGEREPGLRPLRVQFAGGARGGQRGRPVGREPVQARGVQPGAGQPGEAGGGFAGQGACIRQPVEVCEVAGEHAPGFRQVRPGGVDFAQPFEQFVAGQQREGQFAEGLDRRARQHLAQHFPVDERERRAAARGIGGESDQPVLGMGVVNVARQRRAEMCGCLVVLPGAFERARQQAVGGRVGRVEVAGRPCRGERFFGPPLAHQQDRQFAQGPGVPGGNRQQVAQRGLGGARAQVGEPLVAQPQQSQVVGKALAPSGEPVDHRRWSGAAGEQVEDRLAGIGGGWFAGDDILPPGEGGGEVALLFQPAGLHPRPLAGRGVGACRREVAGGAGGIAAAHVETRGIELQRAVVGVAGEGFVEHPAGFLVAVGFIQHAHQGAGGLGGFGTEQALALAQALERLVAAPEQAGRVEPLARQTLAGRRPRSRESVGVQRRRPAFLGPPAIRPGLQNPAVEGGGRVRLAQPFPGLAAGARVAGQLDREVAPDRRVGALAPGAFAQVGQQRGARRMQAQPGGRGGDQPRVVGKMFEQAGDRRRALALVVVVGGQRAPQVQGQAMSGGQPGEFRRGRHRSVAAMAVQGPVEGEHLVEQVRLRQFQRVQPRRRRRRQGRQPARPVQRVFVEKRAGRVLAEMVARRILDNQGLAPQVVADHRLQMRRIHLDRAQREGDARVDQGAQAVPGHAELAGVEFVVEAPLAFGVVVGAVVADRVGDGVVGGRVIPEAGQHGQGGGAAGIVFLQDPRRGESHPSLRAGVLQALCQGGEVFAAGQGGLGGRGGGVAAQRVNLAAARGQPFASGRFQQRAGGFVALEQFLHAGMVVALAQRPDPLAEHLAALQMGGCRRKHRDRFAGPQQFLQGVRLHLDRRAEPGLPRQRLFAAFQRLIRAFLAEQDRGRLGRQPRRIRVQRQRFVQQPPGQLEVAVGCGHPAAQRQEIAAQPVV
jgi:hypothetical protein